MRALELIRKSIRDPQKAVKRLVLLAGRWVGSRRYVPFIVLSRSRTGSNLLISMLDSHPAIVAGGELFGQLRGRSVDDVLAEIYCRHLPPIKAVGFKIFYYHPIDDPSGTVWRRLDEIEELRVIHLKRRNILRTLVSRKIAGQTDVWGHRKDEAGVDLFRRQVEMSREELVEGFEETQRWEADFRRRFGDRIVTESYYEDLIADPEAEFQRVTQALGVRPARPQIPYRKQNPEGLRALLTNYAPLKLEFAGTRWAHFFDE